MLFDTHAHYDSGAFNADRMEVLASMPEQGVELILNPGCDLETSRTAVSLANTFDFVYAAVGVHPSDCETYTDQVEVTGDQNGKGIGTVGHAHRPKALRTAHRPGNIPVGAGLAPGDFKQRVPHLPLEGSALGAQGEIEGFPRSAQIFQNLRPSPFQQGCGVGHQAGRGHIGKVDPDDGSILLPQSHQSERCVKLIKFHVRILMQRCSWRCRQ